MDLKWMAIFLVGVMLLAGCAGNGQANAGANANAGSNGTANANANANANVGGNANAGNNGTANASASANANANGNANAGGNAAQVLGLLAMQASGIPTQCTIKTVGEQNTTLYIKGSNMRAESTINQNNNTYSVTSIIKTDAYYVDTKAFAAEAPGCDWMEFNASASQNGTTTSQQVSGAMDEKTLNDLPPTDFSCSPAIFGDEKFATPGKVCTFEEVMTNALQNSGLNVNVSGSGNADAGSGGLTADQQAQVCASITNTQQRAALGCP